MKNIYTLLDKKTLLQINAVSIFITAICELFSILLLVSKIKTGETEDWKFKAMIIGVVIVSILFVFSVASFIYFLKIKGKTKD